MGTLRKVNNYGCINYNQKEYLVGEGRSGEVVEVIEWDGVVFTSVREPQRFIQNGQTESKIGKIKQSIEETMNPKSKPILRMAKIHGSVDGFTSGIYRALQDLRAQVNEASSKEDALNLIDLLIEGYAKVEESFSSRLFISLKDSASDNGGK